MGGLFFGKKCEVVAVMVVPWTWLIVRRVIVRSARIGGGAARYARAVHAVAPLELGLTSTMSGTERSASPSGPVCTASGGHALSISSVASTDQVPGRGKVLAKSLATQAP